MSDFLLFFVKILIPILVLSIVILRIRWRNEKKKESLEENEKPTEPLKYTFSSIFPNEDIMRRALKIIRHDTEEDE